MSDTQRTTAALQALLADNTSGGITPQVVRDLLVSVFGGYAWIYVESGAVAQTVNIAAAKLTGFAAAGTPSNGPVPDAVNDQITTPIAGDYLVEGDFALTATAARTVQFQLRKNGVAVAGARSRAKFNASGDLLELSFAGLVTCAANDVLTVYAAADVDGSSITLVDGSLIVRRIG